MSDPTPMAAATPWPRPISPVLNFAPELLLAAQGVRAAIFDVDGCLTDGRIYIGEHGESVKAFSTLDGHGIKLLARAGIEPVVINQPDKYDGAPEAAKELLALPDRPTAVLCLTDVLAQSVLAAASFGK